MLSKIDKKHPSMSETILVDDVRTAALALIRREEYRVGSRMVAYENISKEIGSSSSWLRQFIGHSDRVSLSFVIGMNILSLHDRLCSKLEKHIREIANEAMEIDLETDRRISCALGSKATNEEVAEALPEDHQPV